MKELTLAASLENIAEVTAFIDEQLEALDCSMKAQMQIDIAIDELFGNIAHYAYPDGTGDATVRFDFDEATRMASIAFIDGGVPFNPLEKADPDVTLSAEEREIGGLGIFMVKKSMDKMEYSYENGFNILMLHKRI
ncbi:MAG: ATP-binding protein [Clostridia bacterium]|nr:ATP-binding protein [Clostridia bacterium]